MRVEMNNNWRGSVLIVSAVAGLGHFLAPFPFWDYSLVSYVSIIVLTIGVFLLVMEFIRFKMEGEINEEM